MSDVPDLETLKQAAEMRRNVRGGGAQTGVGCNGLGLRVKVGEDYGRTEL